VNGKGSSYACYDAEGDLLATLAPGDSQPTTRTYDPAGRLLASAHAGSTDDTLGTVANTYDEAGRITSTTDANGATAIFRYDADGNRLTRTASSAAWDGTSAQLPTFNSYQTTYAYNDADQLTGETDPAGRAYGFFFDGRGNLRGIQYPNGTFSWKETNPDGWTTNQLNRHGTITSATTSPPADATPVADYSYTYSLDGQKLTEQLTGPSSQTRTFAFDSIGRLLTYANVGGAGTSARYCYDFDSNRLQVTATSGAACGTSTYTYNPGNANSPGVDEVSSVGATNYHYTADGQIDCRGSGTVTPCPSTSDNFRWDGVGRLSGATVASKSVCYRFDPGGSLLRRVYDATGAATCTTASSTTNYLLGDLFETNASGAVTTRYQDGPAGALESDTGMPAAASDTYTRSIAIGSGWGSGDIGGAWSTRANSTVSTAQFGVSGSAGQISLAAASIRYTATLPAAVTDFDVKVRVKIAATPTGSGSGLGYYLFGRSDASGDNSYAFSLGQSLTNAGSLNIWKRVSGTPTSLASNGAWGTLTPNSYYWLRARETGTTLSFKAWADGTAEPTTWTLTTSDTTLHRAWLGRRHGIPRHRRHPQPNTALGRLQRRQPGQRHPCLPLLQRTRRPRCRSQ
jgi:YD repeat-containing protein